MIDLLITILYFYMLALIPLGAIQVLVTLYKSFKRSQPTSYYNDLKKYWSLIVLYFCIWFIGSQVGTEWIDTTASWIFFITYICIPPTLLAVYNFKIMRREYPQEIENLIF